MSLLMLFAALLLLAVGVVLYFAARGAPGQYRWAAPAGLALLSVALYFTLGTPQGLHVVAAPPLAQAPEQAPAPEAVGPAPAQLEELRKLLPLLEAQLEKTPDDLPKLALLGRGWLAVGEVDKAKQVLKRAVQLGPERADLIADLADAHIQANGQRWDDDARKLVAFALERDPAHPKSLALAASDSMERGRFNEALQHWERLLAVAPAQSPLAELANAGLVEAKAQLAAAGAMPSPVTSNAPSDAAAPFVIEGELSLAPELAKRVGRDAVVFISARTGKPGMPPVAALKLKAGDLPAKFRLDDSNAVAGTLLSAQSEVVVSARLAASGSATREAGDAESAPQTVRRGTAALKLRIGG